MLGIEMWVSIITFLVFTIGFTEVGFGFTKVGFGFTESQDTRIRFGFNTKAYKISIQLSLFLDF